MQINNLKLLSKFHVARPKRFRVISKSLETSHSLVGKWPSENKGTRDASVGRFNNVSIIENTIAIYNGNFDHAVVR